MYDLFYRHQYSHSGRFRHSSFRWWWVGVAGALFFFFVVSAHAATLNFTTNNSVTLSSPQTTFTIAAGSVADNVGINATSVFVTLSSSTGGNFTLLSPSYDLSVATSSAGGTVAISCSGGIETAVLSQNTGSTIYTITPTTSKCANASAPVFTETPSATNIDTTDATIDWTTNIAADSTVLYGTSTAYGASSTDQTLVTTHSISLSSLSESTLYHYEVISSEYGTSTTSGDNTFTTTAPSSSSTTITNSGGSSSYSLSINGGAGTTQTPSVTLSLYGTGAYMMEVSNTSTFAGATWIPYVATMPWTLASNTGTQTVYVQYESVGGNIIGSAEASINLIPSSIPATSSSLSTPSLSGMSVPQLQALLASLESELQTLEAEAGISTVSPAPTPTRSLSSYRFTRDLQSGMTGNDVKQLQLLLIKANAGPAARKLKAHGTTTNFATLTKAALIEFQKSVGITPDSGYFGPITRGWVARHE